MPRVPDLCGVALGGRYELHAIIGEGTFGRVYSGRDRRLARAVAVKVIKPWWGEDPDWAATFEREAQLLASISDPGIVQIFDVGAAAEGLYYVAELVEGESLAHRLSRGPLALAEALDVGEQLGRALSRAHARRIVHRDIKPANVLISREGRIKVGDFGVARLAEGSSDGVGATIVGTPRYMAPEQARGGAITPATDVYGVGVVLYEMLCGHVPFEGETAVELALRHVNDPPPPLPETVPPEVSDVVLRALAKQAGSRYADAGALADALENARVAEPASVSAGRPGTATQPMTAAGRSAPASTNGKTRQLARTRVGEPMFPRRNVNPSERRQRVALFALVLLLGVAMGAVALALARGQAKVPELQGLARARASAALRRADLKPSFVSRYSSSPVGTAVGQSPAAGRRVDDGTTVRVALSAGPAPVAVPQLAGLSTAAAQSALGRLRLRATVSAVPAPWLSPGTVAAQSPTAGVLRVPGSSVAVQVAESPRWRPLTSFAGENGARSVPLRIRGRQWQIVYSMGYQGTCTFLLICSGPTATVTNAGTGGTVDSFSLDSGSGNTRTFTTGPGVFQISVTSGSDTAKWSIRVDDHY